MATSSAKAMMMRNILAVRVTFLVALPKRTRRTLIPMPEQKLPILELMV
jgi:hypothetical protein